jgi:GDP-4-dehydro-6-deoxy-D-mannose reductase
VDALVAAAGTEVEVAVDVERLRPADVPAQVGDPRRLREATGWEPRLPLEQTLRDLLQDWRERLGSGVRAPSGGR